MTWKKWVGIGIGAGIAWLIWLYFNLDVGQSPRTSDVIIVNEGELYVRASEGVDLYQEGYADKIIVSPPTDTNMDAYYEAGIPQEDLIMEWEATSTWTNAVNSIALMEALGYDSAIVLSSDYHMRRVRLAYERAGRGKDLDFTYVSAYWRDDQGQPVSYLDHPTNRWAALRELYKYPGYLLALYHWIDLE